MQIDETQTLDKLYEEWQTTLPALRELLILKLEEYIEQGHIIEKHQQTRYDYNDEGEQHIVSEKIWEIKKPVPQWMREAVKGYRMQ